MKKRKNNEEIKKIKIKVIGIGGGGGNIVNELSQNIKKASFVVADTDIKALKKLGQSVEKFQFGQETTKGLGTGMDWEKGELAAKKEKERIKKILEGQDFVILISSLGGGVGSGASPIFAKISQNLGNLTYGIFTLPFSFEGEKKKLIAFEALKRLKTKLNTFTVLPNERIFQIIDKNTPLKNALSTINKILAQNLQGLIEVIYSPGIINIDFADLKTIFEGRGLLTYLNMAETGEEKEKIERTLNFPLYPYNIEGAKNVLFNIFAPPTFSLNQVNQISRAIFEKVNKEAKIIFGISRLLKTSQTKFLVVATGCRSEFLNLMKVQSPKIFQEKKKIKKNKKKRIIIKTEEKESKPKDTIVRKNALSLKEEIKKEEAEILNKEKIWETPAFLRKKLIKGQF